MPRNRTGEASCAHSRPHGEHEQAERQFAIANNRKPTPDELAERPALPVQKVELLKRCGRDVNSMDENIYNNNAKAATNNEVKDRLQSSDLNLCSSTKGTAVARAAPCYA